MRTPFEDSILLSYILQYSWKLEQSSQQIERIEL